MEVVVDASVLGWSSKQLSVAEVLLSVLNKNHSIVLDEESYIRQQYQSRMTASTLAAEWFGRMSSLGRIVYYSGKPP